MTKFYVVRKSYEYGLESPRQGMSWLNSKSGPKVVLAPAAYNIRQGDLAQFISKDTQQWYDRVKLWKLPTLDQPYVLAAWVTNHTLIKFRSELLRAKEVLILEWVEGEIDNFLREVDAEDFPIHAERVNYNI